MSISFLTPSCPRKYILRPSPIHGTGVFSTSWINAGEWVEKSVENKTGHLKLTPFRRHLNHCGTHFNVMLKERTKGEFWNYTVTSIKPYAEITTNYDRDAAAFPHVVGPAESFYNHC